MPEAQATISAPKVWLLLGERRGDNAQVMALGKALGWPYEVKQLQFDPDCPIPFKKRGASLIGVDLARSSPLTAPWPDIVIAIGRRSAPPSRWIKESTKGDAMIIHLGRPRVAFHHFDLILTTPQYGLPPGPNIISLTFPITLNSETELSRAADEWQPKLAHLPRPWTAVFIGGPTSQMRFERDVGTDLLAKAEAHVADKGSLLITTSPRTSMDVADLAQYQIKTPHFLFRWSRTEASPYLAFLKLADEFIVTSDSMSMIAESIDRRKPLFVFELPVRTGPRPTGLMASIRWYFTVRRQSRQTAGLKADFIDFLYDMLTRFGKARPRRHTLAFCRRLYQMGLARPLVGGQVTQEKWTLRPIIEEERNMALRRIRELYESRYRGRARSQAGSR